jgi:hypothetical protein
MEKMRHPGNLDICAGIVMLRNLVGAACIRFHELCPLCFLLWKESWCGIQLRENIDPEFLYSLLLDKLL